MTASSGSRFFSLVQREMREYKNSLFWTPIVTVILLALMMLASATFATRFSFLGDWVLDRLIEDGSRGVAVSLSISEDGDERTTYIEMGGDDSPEGLQSRITVIEEGTSSAPVPPPAPTPPYEVVVIPDVQPEAWNFSREWNFNPESAKSGNGGNIDDEEGVDVDGRELNFVLSIVHGILILILVLTTTNYLLSALYDDRKDRSILFFRSMPVSEWETVLSKFVVAMVVAPLVYLAASLILQVAYVAFMIVMVWRVGESPQIAVLQNIDFVSLMLDPISGWILTALLIAPTYAWLLCASALARRSPFLMAITPLIVLLVAEGFFFGSEHIGNAVQRHVPHLSDESSVGFYLLGPDWTHLNLLSLVSGLALAAVMLGAAVWLRRNRWELKS